MAERHQDRSQSTFQNTNIQAPLEQAGAFVGSYQGASAGKDNSTEKAAEAAQKASEAARKLVAGNYSGVENYTSSESVHTPAAGETSVQQGKTSTGFEAPERERDSNVYNAGMPSQQNAIPGSQLPGTQTQAAPVTPGQAAATRAKVSTSSESQLGIKGSFANQLGSKAEVGDSLQKGSTFIKVQPESEKQSGEAEDQYGYNGALLDKNGLRQAVVDTAQKPLEETDAYQAYKKIDSKAKLIGVEGLGGSIADGIDAKVSLSSSLYAKEHVYHDSESRKLIVGQVTQGKVKVENFQKKLRENNLTPEQTEKLQYQLDKAKEKLQAAQSRLQALDSVRSGSNGINNMKVSTDSLQQIFGSKYIVSQNRTGNVVNDYRNNMSLLEGYLQANHINTRNLDPEEIVVAFRGGTIGSKFVAAGSRFVDGTTLIRGKSNLADAAKQNAMDPTWQSVAAALAEMQQKDPIKAQQMRDVLTEYAYLKRQAPKVKSLQSNHRAKTVAKAWVNETMGDSAAKQGLDTTMTAIGAAKTAGWIGKGLGGAAATGGSYAVEAFLNHKDKKALKNAKSALADGKASLSPENVEKFSTDAKAIQERLKNREKAFQNFRDKTAWATKTSATDKVKTGFGKIGQKISDKTGLTKLINKRQAKYAKFVNSKGGKVLGKISGAFAKPFQAVSVIRHAVRKTMLVLAGGILAIFLITCIALNMYQSFFTFMSETSRNEESQGDDFLAVPNSPMQKAIDYIYEYHTAYYENVAKADPASENIWRGIPENWRTLVDQENPELHTLQEKLNSTVRRKDITAPQPMEGDEYVTDMGADAPQTEESQEADEQSQGSPAHQAPKKYAEYGAEDPDDVMGYNFSHYWGPQDRVYNFEFATQKGTGEYKNNASGELEEIMEDVPHKIDIIKSYAGIGLDTHFSKDLGDYMSSAPVDEESYEQFDMHEDCSGALELPDQLNMNVEVVYRYKGSLFSFKITPEQYKQAYFYILEYQDENKRIDYNNEMFYRAMAAMAFAMTNNSNEGYAYYKKYNWRLFYAAMNNADVDLRTTFVRDESHDVVIDVTDSEGGFHEELTSKCWIPKVKVVVTVKDAGIQDLMKLDRDLLKKSGLTPNEYAHLPENESKFYSDEYGSSQNTWNGWYDISEAYEAGQAPTSDWLFLPPYDGSFPPAKKQYQPMSDAMEQALQIYELGEGNFNTLFPDLVIPGEPANPFSEAEIELLLKQLQEIEILRDAEGKPIVDENGMYIDLNGNHIASYETGISEERMRLIEEALKLVGTAHYRGGGGHVTADQANQNFSALDCSGFVSVAMMRAGMLNSAYTTSGFVANMSSTKKWGHDLENLQPGDLLVKNADVNNPMQDHVVLYLGVVQLPGDNEPKPHFVECTSNHNGAKYDGPQIMSDYRVGYVTRNYLYKVDPFAQ